MKENTSELWGIVLKTAVVHSASYFLMGLLAFFFLDYSIQYAETSLNLLMRQTTDPLVMAGPLFQPIRGVLFGITFYLLREVLFNKKNGWLITWAVLVIIGIISTFGPAPGSIEGLIYTTLPLSVQLTGQIEVYAQSFLLAFVTFYWVTHPEKKWLNWVLGIIAGLTLVFPIMGLLFG